MYYMRFFLHLCRVSHLLSLVVALLSVVACTEQVDDFTAVGDRRTATVRLLIPQTHAATRVASYIAPTDPDYETQLIAEESAIYTLRIVIYSLHANNNATTINRFYTAEELEKAQTDTEGNYVLTIKGVPAGPAQICVLANEVSIGQDYSDILTMQRQTVDVETIGTDGTTTIASKVLIVDEDYRYFPKRGTELLAETTRKGLPMSWMVKNRSINAAPDADNTFNVELERCVSKLRMEIKNSFSADIKVREISFGQFFR